jgi:phage protein D
MSRHNGYRRVTISSDTFFTGDSKLIDCSVTLGEGSSISSCSFSVRASTELVDRYFQTIYDSNGLDPVVIPSQEKNNSSSNSSGTYSGSVPAIQGISADKIKQAINFYLSKGLSLEGSCFLIGTYIQESSLNHLANNGLGNIGLAQWDGSRQATNGGIPLGANDFLKQLNWALLEMVSDSTNSGLNHNLRGKVNGADINAITKAIIDWERFGSGEQGGRFSYGAQLLEALKKNEVKDSAKQSTIAAQNPKTVSKPESVTKQVSTGNQITIESGFNNKVLTAYSFLHTSIAYDFNKRTLTFGGQASSWILTQRVKSTAYKDCTLKQIAQKICDAHGLKLEYKGNEITYKYFPQLGITDYECLLLECRRIGYRLNVNGVVLTIAPRESRKPTTKIGAVTGDKTQLSDFILEYGTNLTTFSVTHTAGSNSGGARSSSPSERESTGETKFELDPDTGKIAQTRKEDKTGSGIGATGYHTATIKPLTDGKTDEADKTRRENELRIKGIIAEFSCPCDSDTLLLTPDSIFQTYNISQFLDRVWTVESVTHTFNSSGSTTSGTVYSPMKNKYPPAEKTDGTATQGERSSLRNEGGFIDPTAGKSTRTSGFGYRPAYGRNHNGTDLANSTSVPIYASKKGTVIDIQNTCAEGDRGCGGGFGNLVFIDHNDGYVTHYAHLKQSSVTVFKGQTVEQGDQIALMGNTGGSDGQHLHFEIVKNNTPINPEGLIKFS